ncbi:unnamed protein product [Ranitomeya imitator]|uniref:Homeobox domain-containing protein n=1 Tax=Ranitomeya imitator TaxID=111125 RepID=A0ABN9KRC6_9NEOB|nr:unnamed protein product [Ranitomeya imitator]
MEKRKKTKELSEDLRNQIARKHEQSQGYKSISKDQNIPVSTVRNVIKKFKAHGTVANLPRCGWKRKIDKRFQRKIVRMLDKEPRLTSKQVQAALQSEGTTVSTRTIRRRLNEKGLYVLKLLRRGGHTIGATCAATQGPKRFEKLDITPKSAQKLKPVLEKWLNEAEMRNLEGQQNLMEFVGGEPSKKRKRRTSFTPQAVEALNIYFEKNALPTGQEITDIAKELNYDREVVRVWFCNRRQTLKNTSKLNVFQIP